eukprot:TRINITY_DN3161_c0_g1_i1.p1 TRINITY_DN3161_c0_g1~~TRINITY_DN3161_c0_g1_i1.p1  ORF type:complete len:469 (-),score=123.33 TRINITY_DN3161_c0_g1_i1:616-2022(-)
MTRSSQNGALSLVSNIEQQMDYRELATRLTVSERRRVLETAVKQLFHPKIEEDCGVRCMVFCVQFEDGTQLAGCSSNYQEELQKTRDDVARVAQKEGQMSIEITDRKGNPKPCAELFGRSDATGKSKSKFRELHPLVARLIAKVTDGNVPRSKSKEPAWWPKELSGMYACRTKELGIDGCVAVLDNLFAKVRHSLPEIRDLRSSLDCDFLATLTPCTRATLEAYFDWLEVDAEEPAVVNPPPGNKARRSGPGGKRKRELQAPAPLELPAVHRAFQPEAVEVSSPAGGFHARKWSEGLPTEDDMHAVLEELTKLEGGLVQQENLPPLPGAFGSTGSLAAALARSNSFQRAAMLSSFGRSNSFTAAAAAAALARIDASMPLSPLGQNKSNVMPFEGDGLSPSSSDVTAALSGDTAPVQQWGVKEEPIDFAGGCFWAGDNLIASGGFDGQDMNQVEAAKYMEDGWMQSAME